MIADRADWWPPEPGPGTEDTETAVTTSALGLILLTGAAVVLAAIVAARVAHGIGLPGLLVPRWSGMREGESGLNDPPAVLAVTLLSSPGGHLPSPALIAVEIVYALAAGAAIGLVAGLASAFVLRRIALPASGLYPIAI